MAQKNNRRSDELDQAKEMWEQGKDKAEEIAENVSDEAKAMWRNSSKRVRESAQKMKEYGDEHPWQMAAAGVAVGFILASLFTRRRE